MILDYAGLDAIIGRESGKRRPERIPVGEAKPDQHQADSAWMPPDLVSVPEEEWQAAVERFEILKPLMWVARNARIVTNAADAFDSPEQGITGEVVNRIDGIHHPQIIAESMSLKGAFSLERDMLAPSSRPPRSSPHKLALPFAHSVAMFALNFAKPTGICK